MKKVVAICGKSGAGKDTLVNGLNEQHMLGNYYINKIISCTTRPKRDYEVNGKDYFFIDPILYYNNLNQDRFIEGCEFNGWFYGTLNNSIKQGNFINVGIFNLNGIFILQENPNIDLLTFYLNVDPITRLTRLIQRENNPNYKEIFRRFLKDEKDFIDMPDNYIEIPDDKGSMTLEDKINFVQSVTLDFFK